MGDFADARRRLIAKIEGCEVTHQYMIKEGLSKRGVNIENYYRFNVEIGVGDFGMNEWNRLADISTNTRKYLGKSAIQGMTLEAAVKLAKIHRAKARFDSEGVVSGGGGAYKTLPDVPEAYPGAIELPADYPTQPRRSPPGRPSYESGLGEKLEVPGQVTHSPSPRSSSENQPRYSLPKIQPNRFSTHSIVNENGDKFVVHSPTPGEYHTASGSDKISIVNIDDAPKPPPQITTRVEPPPLPPKTPIQDPAQLVGGGSRPPYPLDDGPPPPVNMAGKPKYGR